MGRLPRFIPPGSTVEITARTVAARFLLTPTPQLTEAILGVLGRALSLFPVDLHAFVFLSNHWHALVTVPDAEALSQFLCHVHSNVARAAQRLHGWEGPVWSRGAQTIAVVDDRSAAARLRYVLSHGVKEGLVSSPLEWPGAASVAALVTGRRLVGRWRDGRRASQLAKSGRRPHPVEVTTDYPIELAPLPAWQGLDAVARQARVRALIEEIEVEARELHPRPLGIEAVLSQKPEDRPPNPKRSAAPRVHGATCRTRRAFLQARDAFLHAYRAASVELRTLEVGRFPRGAFPCRPAFVGVAASARAVAFAAFSASQAIPARAQRGAGRASVSSS